MATTKLSERITRLEERVDALKEKVDTLSDRVDKFMNRELHDLQSQIEKVKKERRSPLRRKEWGTIIVTLITALGLVVSKLIEWRLVG